MTTTQMNAERPASETSQSMLSRITDVQHELQIEIARMRTEIIVARESIKQELYRTTFGILAVAIFTLFVLLVSLGH